jgi:hypothetical protein
MKVSYLRLLRVKKISPVESKIPLPAYGKFREFCVSHVLKGW